MTGVDQPCGEVAMKEEYADVERYENHDAYVWSSVLGARDSEEACGPICITSTWASLPSKRGTPVSKS